MIHARLQVLGVITRKDIAEANAKLALGRKANLGLTTPSESLVRPSTLPFIPYEAYDPTVGRSGYAASSTPEPLETGIPFIFLLDAFDSHILKCFYQIIP